MNRAQIRNIAFVLMIVICGYGWYTSHNAQPAQETVVEESTEAKGEMVLHTEPELTIEDGSMINISFYGTYEGEDVGSSENADVTVGGGKLTEEFSQALIGHHPGDEFTAKIHMSDRLAVKKKYRGKEADVKIIVNGIYVVE